MLGKYITKRRKELGWSGSELARRCGHPISTIHNLETGLIKIPRFDLIIDISEALQVSLDDMKKAFKEKGEHNAEKKHTALSGTNR